MFLKHIILNLVVLLITDLSKTHRKKTSLIFSDFLFVLFFFQFYALHAQVQNDGEIYIGDSGLLYIETGDFDFGLGTIKTSRTKLVHGVLSFSDIALYDGATTNQFVDGYIQSKAAFVFPIGHSIMFGPIQALPTGPETVEAAYFMENPNVMGSILDKSISKISSVEYWDIVSKGVDTNISLSWRPFSAISALTNATLTNLTIVGWNGLSWEPIPSTVDQYSLLGDISVLDSGSISSNVGLDVSKYLAFSLGANKESVDANTQKLIIYIDKNKLFIEASLPITALIIYDLLGQKIVSEKIQGGLKYIRPFSFAESVYIAKVELNNGSSLITAKIMNVD